ncbi:MAG: hypothetical protein RIS94_1253 [Pseudomonadota bacterium]|jgi:hypothetical protein
MAGYKEPGLEARRNAAAEARTKALQALKAKPALDPAVVAERIAKAEAREKLQAEKREAAKAKREQEAAEKAAAAAAAAPPPPPTEAERKAARDARYAARKARAK